MDPVTHALGGAILARAVPKQPLPKSSLLLLIGMAMLPDIDIILRGVSDIFYLRHHRGVTHSLLMLPLWTWLIFTLLPANQNKQPMMPWLIGLALLLHIFLDLVTSFGTMLFSPLSDARAALDLIFIIDPIFSTLLLAPLLLIIWPLKRHARSVAIISLCLAGSYVAGTAYLHQKSTQLTRLHHPSAEHVNAMPLPFSPFHWMLVASYPDHEARSAVNFFPAFPGTAPLFPKELVDQFTVGTGTPEKLTWQSLSALRSLENIEELPGIAFYRWFARFPVILEKSDRHLLLGDLRFETMDLKRDAFRLLVELDGASGEKSKAWLLWRGERKSDLTDIGAPSTSW